MNQHSYDILADGLLIAGKTSMMLLEWYLLIVVMVYLVLEVLLQLLIILKIQLIVIKFMVMVEIIICILELLLLIVEVGTHDATYEPKATQLQVQFGMITQNIVKPILFKVAVVLEKLAMTL